MDDKQKNVTPDAAARLWGAIASAYKDLAANRYELGKLCRDLQNLFSERSHSAAGRRSSSHGTFQAELLKRGYKPNRVREWIRDYEVEAGLRPPAESTAAKRRARRSNSAEYERGYQAATRDASTLEDPLSRFASLLPFRALKAAYRAALQELHPDHGGSEERTKALIGVWEEIERLHSSVAANGSQSAPEWENNSTERAVQ